ncbi:EAL domain-containing protein [Photobacterium sanguinicancri]|uniref:EAL domain-containing protein n=1 Tax=Photobacterium sanguinicancri TaxID=875932 RepID=UPI002480D73E|nr:EAL domain-containing protein [Photobacterium sanguinicancri]
MRLHLKKYNLLITVWVLTLVVTLPSISYVFIKSWETHKGVLANKIDALSDGFNYDINTNLASLNERFPTAQVCDKAVIQVMKQVDYNAKYLTDFAVVHDNQIICTSESGMLTEPITLPKPNWVTAGGVSIILGMPIPLFDGQVTGITAQVGSFLAFLDYQQSESKTDHLWLKYINYGLNKGKKTYSYGDKVFSANGFVELVSGRQWYEDGHWLFSECRGDTECKIIAVDILAYFEAEKTAVIFSAVFLFILMSLMALLGLRLHRWLYSLPRQIRYGMNNQQLELHYQPIIGFVSGEIEGCEVLCRWHTVEGKLIRPDEFIAMVETNRQTRELTELVVSRCIADLQHAELLGKCRVAINAFPDDIASGHILRVFRRQLPIKDYSTFTIELTEQKISDLPALSEGVRQLRMLGFQVAIDDFGTGFSNLEGLRELSVDILKIDKSFVWGAEKPSLKQSLIEHIVNIAKSLQLKIVAEGVETQEQFNFLRSMEVDYSQGYLHSRPVCLSEFANLLNTSATVSSPIVQPG